jgi:hypothetical protein
MKLFLWIIAIVAAVLAKSGNLVQILVCLALFIDILHSSIPPVALVSSASDAPSSRCLLREVAAIAWPMRTIHFLRDDKGSAERMRTVDAYYWEEAYGSFADIVPVVVIDCSTVTPHLRNEARYMLNPIRCWKAIFVSNESGNCPLLQSVGLVDLADPTITIVIPSDLRDAVMHRLNSWIEILHQCK